MHVNAQAAQPLLRRPDPREPFIEGPLRARARVRATARRGAGTPARRPAGLLPRLPPSDEGIGPLIQRVIDRGQAE
jgi:hypothetical protein